MGYVAGFLCTVFQIQDVLGTFPIPCFQETQNLALTMLLYISKLSCLVKWISSDFVCEQMTLKSLRP